MASTHEEIIRLVEETKAAVPVSTLEGWAAIMKELDEVQDEMKLIKKTMKDVWTHIKDNEVADAVSLTMFVETEAEKMTEASINLAATAVEFRNAFRREGGEGWHY